jgi:hypothetical protein
MKCKNCGLERSAHIPVAVGDGPKIWQCPDGSGGAFPAIVDIQIELHYRAGEDSPWIASWVHPIFGKGQVAATRAEDALEQAGHAIEASLEEKTDEEKTIEKVIRETRHK